jgi:nucleotide-binding universal stress UspA family protein
MARARLAEGSVLDGFTIGKQIRAGGMALLWEVTHPAHELPMLMKVPALFEGEDPAAIVGFEMEQMILPRLSGPHVPKFVAAGDFAVQPYIAMERIPGGTLTAMLDRLPLPVDMVASLGAKIALALDDLHRQHAVHLDVKPANVMFRDSGEAVMIDFGLSSHAYLPDLMEEEFRVPYGSAPYMAPEQVLGERRDPAADVFALGAMLYHLATGEMPFGDPQRLAGLRRRLWRDPVPPRKLRPDLPPWLQEIVLRCLAVDPAARPPTAAQLAFELLHPAQIGLTALAERMSPDPFLTVWRRRMAAPKVKPPRRADATAARLASAPIVAVAVDLDEHERPTAEALRETVGRILRATPGARLACLNVLKLARLALDSTLDKEGRNKHLLRLVELKHWAEPLRLDPGRLTFHVLEATDAADAILDYARVNRVDHLVMGARARSMKKSLLGSVSAAVAGGAPCTVTVARKR